MKVTAQWIAEQSGVSRGTVDRVVNGRLQGQTCTYHAGDRYAGSTDKDVGNHAAG